MRIIFHFFLRKILQIKVKIKMILKNLFLQMKVNKILLQMAKNMKNFELDDYT